MKLPYSIIKYELENSLGTELIGYDHNCGCVDSVMLHYPGFHASTEGICYISYPFDLDQTDPESTLLFVICGNMDDSMLRESHHSTIVVPSASGVAEALNLVSEILQKYSRWDDTMRELLHSGGSVKNLLDVSVSLFRNQLLVIDSAFRIIASASPNGKSADTLNMYGNVVSNRDMEIVKDDFPRTRNKRGPLLRQLPGVADTLVMNIHDGAFYLGVVCIVQTNEPLRNIDSFLLEKLTGSVRKAFLQQESHGVDEQYSLGYVLAGLVSGKRVEKSRFDFILGSSGIREGDIFRCMAIRLPDSSSREFGSYFYNKLSRRLVLMLIPASEDFAYALIDETWSGEDTSVCSAIISDELTNSGLRAGISMRFTDIYSISLYAEQARQAAIIGAVRPENEVLVSFDECWLEYMLHVCAGIERPITMEPEGFRKLLEHDIDGSRVSYVDTLRVYLENNMNARRSAEVLQITRNSFISRLERIEEILDMDLDDPKVRFQLMFSLFSLSL